MKKWNQRVEKPMEELGLNKDDTESIKIAPESLEAENYERMFGRNQVSEGLWLGGMDRGSKWDYCTSSGLNNHNSGKREAILNDSEKISDNDMDVGGCSSRKNTQGPLQLQGKRVAILSSSRQAKPRMRPLADIIAQEMEEINQNKRHQLREAVGWFPRSAHPAENSGTQKSDNDDKQLGSSGGQFI